MVFVFFGMIWDDIGLLWTMLDAHVFMNVDEGEMQQATLLQPRHCAGSWHCPLCVLVGL